MREHSFYIVDVFAEEKYQGNQLAVFTDAGHLSDEEMQNIARETNFSETTFILSKKAKDGGYDVRIFTPAEEVPFAGHPTLGTAFVIKNELLGEGIDEVNLNLKVGQIPVSFKGDVLWMKQNQPDFGEIFEAKDLAEILGLEEGDFDEKFPIQDVSTGLPFILVPLKNLEAVKKAALVRDKYFKFIENTRGKALFIFSPETYEEGSHINARMFGDYYGVVEDPATGSANGNLAGYLVKHRYFDSNQIDITVEQGYEMKRPSKLYLKAFEEKGGYQIHVGGKVVKVAKGTWGL